MKFSFFGRDFEITGKKKKAEEVQKGLSAAPWHTNSMTAWMPSHPIISLLDSCAAPGGYPRSKLDLYRVMMWAFPFLSRGAEIRTDFMGEAVFEHPDERIKEILNDWFYTSFKIFTSVDTGFNTVGGAEFARMVLRESFDMGQAHTSYVRDEQGVIIGARIYDAAGFEPVWQQDKPMYQVARLEYNGLGGIVPIIPELMPDFRIFINQQSVIYPWGLPIHYEAEYYADKLLRLLLNRGETHSRLANPPSLTSISPADPIEKLESLMSQTNSELLKNHMNEVKAAYMSMLQRARSGRSSDAVMISPVALAIQSKMFGEGVQGMNEFPEESQIYMQQMASCTGVPVEFLGFSTGGGGLSGDKFRIQKNLLETKRNSDRQKMAAYLADMGAAYLASIKLPPSKQQGISVAFSGIDINDAKLEAETEKVTAESMAVMVANYTAMLMDITPEAASKYAESVGHPEWVQQAPGGDE